MKTSFNTKNMYSLTPHICNLIDKRLLVLCVHLCIIGVFAFLFVKAQRRFQKELQEIGDISWEMG